MTDADPRLHPAYPQLVARYTAALAGWRQVQDIGPSLGFTCRGYCDLRLALYIVYGEPIMWSGTGTDDGALTAARHEAAYRDAGGER